MEVAVGATVIPNPCGGFVRIKTGTDVFVAVLLAELVMPVPGVTVSTLDVEIRETVGAAVGAAAEMRLMMT